MKNYTRSIFNWLIAMFVFIFISFFCLRWNWGDYSISFGNIALDLTRVILITLHVLLSYYGAVWFKAYLPMLFTVTVTAATSYFLDTSDKSMEFIGIFHALNFSYLFIEISLSIFAVLVVKNETEKQENEIQIKDLKEQIKKYESDCKEYEIKIRFFNEKFEALRDVKNSLVNDLKQSSEKLNYSNIENVKMRQAIDKIDGCWVGKGANHYSIGYDFKEQRFKILREYASKDQKPTHLIDRIL